MHELYEIQRSRQEKMGEAIKKMREQGEPLERVKELLRGRSKEIENAKVLEVDVTSTEEYKFKGDAFIENTDASWEEPEGYDDCVKEGAEGQETGQSDISDGLDEEYDFNDCRKTKRGFETESFGEDGNFKANIEYTIGEYDYVGHSDQKFNNVESLPEKLKCRNEDLEGRKHLETGVPFKRKQIEVNGKQYEVVVPEFESSYDAQIPENMYEATDHKQFKECNLQLKNEIAVNKDFREKFDNEQLAQIENGDLPDGYTWHHDAEVGKMQLVDTEIHQKTAHTGGRSIWGGGTDNR